MQIWHKYYTMKYYYNDCDCGSFIIIECITGMYTHVNNIRLWFLNIINNSLQIKFMKRSDDDFIGKDSIQDREECITTNHVR